MINFWFHVFSSDNTFHIEIFQCNLYLTSYGSTKKGVDVSKKLYSKLKVAHKNAQKWTKTVFFKHEPAHKAGELTSLEMTSWLRPYDFRILRYILMKKNPLLKNKRKISTVLQIQPEMMVFSKMHYTDWDKKVNILFSTTDMRSSIAKSQRIFPFLLKN